MLSIFDDSGSVDRLNVDFIVCNNFYLRLKGALGQGRIDCNEAYLLPGVARIHTFFMSEPIAVVGFDTEGAIVRYRNSVPPYRIFPRRTSSITGIVELAPNQLPDFNPDRSRHYLRLDHETALQADLPSLSIREA